MKEQQSCISVFVAYLTFPSSSRGTSSDLTTVFHEWVYGRFIEIHTNLRRKKLHRTNQGSSFLRDSFSNRENVKAPIQFRKESQPKHLKRLFLIKNRPIYFHINSTMLLDWSNETSRVFLALKSTSHFLPWSTVPHRSDLSSEVNSSYCHRSDA